MKKYTMRLLFVLTFILIHTSALTSQDDISRLQNKLISETEIDVDLRQLCDEIGGRVTGSEANNSAVQWALQKFDSAGVDVRKEPFEMPVLWLEENCIGTVATSSNRFDVRIVSKYRTPPGNYNGKLQVLTNLDSIYLSQNAHLIRDNFILFPSELCLDINGLFAEYIQANKIENAARKHGAKGVVFMSSRPQKLLYRYITSRAAENDFPQFVMSREDALQCVRLSEKSEALNIMVDMHATTGNAFESYNVIGEIKGSKRPDEVIIIGAHLDSWAMGTGANDNGCNVAMLIDIARQIKALDIRPERTIRFALWNGEEQGYYGSWAYTRDSDNDLNKHIMAMSIDIGSGGIIGFFTNGREELIPVLDSLLQPAARFGPFNQINVPIIGTDNFDFMMEGVPNLVGAHKPATYGINYHAASDTYDKVDIQSLKQNAAIVSTLLLGLANSDFEFSRHDRRQIEKMIEDTNVEFQMRMFNVWDSWVSGKRGRTN